MLTELSYTSPTASTELKLLGITLPASFYWQFRKNKIKFELIPKAKTIPGDGSTLAYSIAELGEMIPWGYFQNVVFHKMPGGFWQVKLSDGKMHSYRLEVEARAYYLIDLIKSKQIALDEVNHPENYSPVLPSGKPSPAKAKK